MVFRELSCKYRSRSGFQGSIWGITEFYNILPFGLATLDFSLSYHASAYYFLFLCSRNTRFNGIISTQYYKVFTFFTLEKCVSMNVSSAGALLVELLQTNQVSLRHRFIVGSVSSSACPKRESLTKRWRNSLEFSLRRADLRSTAEKLPRFVVQIQQEQLLQMCFV